MIMSHNIMKSMAVVALSTLLLTGCSKENKVPHATDVFTSGCLDTKFEEDEEQWKVYWNQGNLIVAHMGWMVPCDLHDVTVDIDVEGSIVTINECGHGGEVDCICNRYNTFNLVGLDHGTYTFVFKVCGEEMHRQEYTI